MRKTTAVLLSAGQGSRLRPITDDRPKGMVKVGGVPILERQLQMLANTNVGEVVVVGGHCHETLPTQGLTKVLNEEYQSTNMAYSLYCAAEQMANADEVLVSYADILYSPSVLDAVLNAEHSANVVVDLDWFAYFSQRAENVLDDAETLQIEGGRIVNIGNKPTSLEEIEGQYIGLMKFDRTRVEAILDLLSQSLATGEPMGWGRPGRSAYMTDLIQEMINRDMAVHPVYINGNWCEIDTPGDLELANSLAATLFDL